LTVNIRMARRLDSSGDVSSVAEVGAEVGAEPPPFSAAWGGQTPGEVRAAG
jgi:hypothetical protein